MVIDLRQNPGGAEEAMLKSIALMVPNKTTVAIVVHRDGKQGLMVDLDQQDVALPVLPVRAHFGYPPWWLMHDAARRGRLSIVS